MRCDSCQLAARLELDRALLPTHSNTSNAGLEFEAAPEEKVEIVEVKQGEGDAAASGDTVVMKVRRRRRRRRCQFARASYTSAPWSPRCPCRRRCSDIALERVQLRSAVKVRVY